jgi:signal peptidase II
LKQSSSKTDADSSIDQKRLKLALITVAVILVVDQISKIWVKTNMYLDESITVFPDWFFIHFIENPGMAFGFEFGGSTGKLFLSIFRIVAIGFFAWYLRGLVKGKAHKGLIFSVALVVAGAAGNMIDSAFYGIIFNESPRFTPEIATMFPAEGGYASFLHGKVVDMLYFPIIDGYLPDWVPYFGGDRIQFFRPVFNIADSAITVGMALILINQKRYFAHKTDEKSVETVASRDELQREQDGK